MKKIILILMLNLSCIIYSQIALIYMDDLQKDHLKAYGVAYKAIKKGYRVSWALNYRGGSFIVEGDQNIYRFINDKGVSLDKITPEKLVSIDRLLEENNGERVQLLKPTKIAVYTPDTSNPWDDAVTMALDYAEIPYTKIYDEEILSGQLDKYDWLHLHHEDFTGQLGKFYAVYSNADWYKEKEKKESARAQRLGFQSVPQLKKTIALKIRDYVEKGGFLFAMCAATDTIDIALSSQNCDICPPEIDKTPLSSDYKKMLDYGLCFAFKDFDIITNAYIYEFSDIDIKVDNRTDIIRSFKLFDFSAKFDKTATILTQNHTRIIKDFLGQTTAFNKEFLKEDVLILGFLNSEEIKYVHGIRGKGTFTFLGGHDPEDYAHIVGEEATELKFHKNSPGYRLILNNVLFPTAKKEKLKT